METPFDKIKENTTVIVQLEMNLNRAISRQDWYDASIAALGLSVEYKALHERCVALGDTNGTSPAP